MCGLEEYWASGTVTQIKKVYQYQALEASLCAETSFRLDSGGYVFVVWKV